MSTKDSTEVSTGLATTATIVAIGCLLVSGIQAASFFGDNIASDKHKFVMISGATVVLLGSQVIARLILRSKSPAWAMIMMLLTCGIAEAASVATSVISFDGNLITARRDQNLASPEARRANELVALYDSQIAAEQANRNKMPELWITRKQQADARIEALIAKREAAANKASAIDVSTSGQAMDRMEAKTKISQSDIALVFAILLSLIPFSINLGLGSLQRSEKSAVKKSQRPILKSVA